MNVVLSYLFLEKESERRKKIKKVCLKQLQNFLLGFIIKACGEIRKRLKKERSIMDSVPNRSRLTIKEKSAVRTITFLQSNTPFLREDNRL